MGEGGGRGSGRQVVAEGDSWWQGESRWWQVVAIRDGRGWWQRLVHKKSST